MSSAVKLEGQTVIVIGGSAGIGLETARRARAEGAQIILTARNAERLLSAGLELEGSIAAFDATNLERLEQFFQALPAPVDHVFVTVAQEQDEPLAELEGNPAQRSIESHLSLPVEVTRRAAAKVRPGGTLLLLVCAGLAHGPGWSEALQAVTRTLASELGSVRVNVIAIGRPTDANDVASLAVQLMADTAIMRTIFELTDGVRSS